MSKVEAKMRIGFDARYVNDRYHGIGRYAFCLLVCLARQSSEHQFLIFLGKGKNSRFDWTELSSLPNVEFQQGPWPLFYPTEQIMWSHLIKKNKLNLFHTPYTIAPYWQLTGIKAMPILITVHDMIFERYPQYMPYSWLRPYYSLLVKNSLTRADRIVTVSSSTARDLMNFYRLSKDKIVVSPEGVDPVFQTRINHEKRVQLRNSYQLTNPYILTVGARRPHKNTTRLVTAFASLMRNIPHDLVFIGPPDNRFPDHARHAAKAKRLNGRIKFLDWVREDDLPGLYQLADLVVLPSLIEGFGLPALEAMASGVPVAVSDNSSYPEVVGKAGLYFDPHSTEQMVNSIREGLSSQYLWEQLREAGIHEAAKFTWEKTATQVIDLYDKFSS